MKNSDLKNKLLSINEAIISSYNLEEDNASLLLGDGGILLFSAYYYKEFNDERNLKFINDLIEAIVIKIGKEELLSSIGFCEGVAGTFWAIKHLCNQGIIALEFDDFSNQIDEYLFNSAINILKYKQNHDFFYGSYGTFLYFLEDTEKHKQKLENILEETIKTVEQDDNFAYWVQKIDPKTNAAFFNFGMAHGYPNYIMFLVFCKIYNIGNQQFIKRTLEKTINFLLHFKQEKEGAFFPALVNKKEIAEQSDAIIWSYGDLSRAIAFIHAGNAFGNASWLKIGLEIAEKAVLNLKKHEKDYALCGLSRGTSGIVMLCHTIYDLTNQNFALKATERWLEITLNNATHENGLAGYKDFDNIFQHKWINSYNLLDGISGIGLVLLSPISGNWNWNRCFLMR